MSLRKNIKLLTWFNFFTSLKFYAPIAIIYFAKVSHSYALGVSIFSLAMITSAILDVPTGIYADVIGRKRAVILGAFFAVLYTIFYAIGINYWFLALGAILQGTSLAFYSGNNNALLHNLLSEEGLADEYHVYYGKLKFMFTIAISLSALIGGIIAHWSFPLVMWLSVIPQIVCILIGIQIIDIKRGGEKIDNLFIYMKDAVKKFIDDPGLRLLSLSSILNNGIGLTSYQFQSAVFNALWPLWAVGIARALQEFLAAVGFYLSGKIIRRFGALKILLIDTIYGWLATLLPAIFPTVLSPLLIASSPILYGPGDTAANVLLQKEFSDEQRATMSSLNSFAGSLFFALFAFGIGLIADKIGPIKSLIVIEVFFTPVIVITWKLFRLPKSR